MDILQAIIVGIVQGLTEFLPVSSSAHLIFIQKALGLQSTGIAFDVLLHLGTLIAVVWYFRADIYKMLIAWWHSIGDILQHRFREVLLEFYLKVRLQHCLKAHYMFQHSFYL